MRYMRKKEKGYTLVEILIAALFIGIALITMASAFTNASSILQKSRHTLTAMGYLQYYAEYMRNLPFSHTYIQTPGTYSIDISDAPLQNPGLYITTEYYDADQDGTNDNDIRKISIKISWDESGTTITKKMVTLINEEGINP